MAAGLSSHGALTQSFLFLLSPALYTKKPAPSGNMPDDADQEFVTVCPATGQITSALPREHLQQEHLQQLRLLSCHLRGNRPADCIS